MACKGAPKPRELLHKQPDVVIGGMNVDFPGQYYESETDLWYNYFRDYDAKMGRISKPIRSVSLVASILTTVRLEILFQTAPFGPHDSRF